LLIEMYTNENFEISIKIK